MQKIDIFLKKHQGDTLIAVFPHADDFAFVAGGLFQNLQKHGIKTKLIVLTDSERESEVAISAKVLGVDDLTRYNYKKGSLAKNGKGWIESLARDVEKINPFAVLTFDPLGVTGDTDHIFSSISILGLFKSKKFKNTTLLWRIADKEEKSHFKVHPINSRPPTYFHDLKLSESITKIKAIHAFKDKFSNFWLKLKVIDFYLFDHKELYYQVDLKKDKFALNIKE